MSDSNKKYEELKAELERLKKLADDEKYHYESSRKLRYQALAGCYMFWQRASKDEKVLEKLHSEYDFQFKTKTKHLIQFTPLLRYLWKMDGKKHSATLDVWNRALNNMHVEVLNKPDYYALKTEQRLIDYIENSGGLKGLTGYEGKVKPSNKADKVKLSKSAEQKLHDAHLQNGKIFFATKASPIAQLPLAQSLPAADMGFTLALLRKANNGYEVIGTTDEQELVEQAVIAAYKRNSEQMPNTARLLTEIIRTQTLPSSIAKLASALTETSKHKVEKATRKQLKRVMYVAANGTFLLSENRTACSVVTVAKPFATIIDTTDDVALAVGDRTYIEDNLIHSGDFNFYTADAAQSVPATENEAASYKLQLQNTVTKKFRYVRFYKLTAYNKPSRYQAAVNSAAPFKSTFTAQLDGKWLASMNSLFLARWINGFAKSIKREEHTILKLAFSKVAVTFGFNYREKSFTEAEIIDLESSAKAKGTLDVLVLSKDIIPVLNALVQLELNGNVTLQADSKMLRFSFKTDCAEYSINVPCCTAKAKRIDSYFVEYGA